MLIHYNPKQIQKNQIIEILDAALAKADDNGPSPLDLDLPISTASLILAAVSRVPTRPTTGTDVPKSGSLAVEQLLCQLRVALLERNALGEPAWLMPLHRQPYRDCM